MSFVTEFAQLQGDTAIAVAIILGCCAIGGALGIGLLASKFIESAARQPELASKLLLRTLLLAALVDAVPMIGVGIIMWFTAASPFAQNLLQLLPQIT